MAKKEENIIEIPDFVKTLGREAEKAYIKWKQIDYQIHHHEHRWPKILVQGGNPDDPDDYVVVDLIQAPHLVRRKLAHLPEKERKMYQKYADELQDLKMLKGRTRRGWDRDFYKPKNVGADFMNINRTKILEWFGQWKTVAEVREMIIKKFKYEISRDKVQRFKIANKERIAELRDEWANNYADFDVAQKRGRIERLAYLSKTQMDKYNLQGKHSVVHSREIRAILEQIRKEIEGDEIKLNIKGEIDVKQTMYVNQSIEQITRKVNINSMIVSLVAAQRGLDPLKFQNRLQQSYYARYTGYGKDVAEEGEEINYPSKMIYNWSDIDKKNEQNAGKNRDIEIAQEIESNNDEYDLRDRIVKRIKERRSELNDKDK